MAGAEMMRGSGTSGSVGLAFGAGGGMAIGGGAAMGNGVGGMGFGVGPSCWRRS